MSLVSSIISFGVSQLGGQSIPGQDGKRPDLSIDTILLGIQFLVFGVGAWYLRQAASNLPDQVETIIFPSTYVTGGAFKWLLTYIIRDPDVQRQLRDRHLHADDENCRGPSKRDEDYGWGENFEQRPTVGTWVKNGVAAGIFPLARQEIVIRFKGKKIWLTMSRQDRRAQTELGLHWTVRTWTWDRHIIDDLLIAARAVHHEKLATDLHVYIHVEGYRGPDWDGPIVRPTRNWESVILPSESKEDIFSDVQSFLNKEERDWYASKGIPHRRGYFLHGPPGAGKTTLVTALASKLGLDLYCLNPGATGMDNDKLNALFRACPRRSMLLIEDIDCILSTKKRRSDSTFEVVGDEDEEETPKSSRDTKSSVTLSGLLNAIDGITSQESSVLFASTNHPGHLDEALLRAGRFDVHVPFTFAKREETAAIFKHFYAHKPVKSDPEAKVKYRDQKLDQAAESFADSVIQPGVKVSIAAIQGFLLLYKRDPDMAQEKVGEWIKELQTKQDQGNVIVTPQK